jgi:hypothetical protein
VRQVRSRANTELRLDSRLTRIRTAAAVFTYRTAAAVRPPLPPDDAPKVVLPVLVGCRAEVSVGDIFPSTRCHIHVDLEQLVIRWSGKHSISLHAIRGVEFLNMDNERSSGRKSGPGETRRKHSFMPKPRRRSSERREPPRGSVMLNGVTLVHMDDDAREATFQIMFIDRCSIPRIAQLSMHEVSAHSWVGGLKALLQLIPSSASPAHTHWASACMAATSSRGTRGFLRRSEARHGLLAIANANTGLTAAALEDALRSLRLSEELHEVPQWLRASRGGASEKQALLNSRQVTELLLRLCTSSQEITKVFERHAVGDWMGLVEWLHFFNTDQLTRSPFDNGIQDGCSPSPRSPFPHREDGLASELAEAKKRFLSVSEMQGDNGLTQLQFSLQLLSSENDAVSPGRSIIAADGLEAPMSHYWTAASHNSYIIGDQLSGVSSSDAYRRLLLQVCGRLREALLSHCTRMSRCRCHTRPAVTHCLPCCAYLRAVDNVKLIVGTAVPSPS